MRGWLAGIALTGCFSPTEPPPFGQAGAAALLLASESECGELDVDDDGYPSLACGGPDCDDSDPGINPGVEENCEDGRDNDCDGSTDLDDVECYVSIPPGDSGDIAPSDYDDEDGDGYPSESDCDDTRADIHPGQEELCDDVDNDCDDLTDDDSSIDAPTWYWDYDGDLYGDPEVVAYSCAQPDGYVSDSTDCDDDRELVNPGMDELCDDEDRDEDCDGLVNDGDDSTLDATKTPFYRDVDEDRYGTARETTYACAVLDGYAAEAGDCDDDRMQVYPGAPEHCNDVDDDCDGDEDEDAVDARTVYLDYDGDGYGDDLISDSSCDESDLWIFTKGDCQDDAEDIHPGASEVCDGEDQDCDDVEDDGAIDAALWFPDADLDGYGAMTTPFLTCEPPSGWVVEGSDCDDADGARNPGEDEHCDDVDEDCDGVADDDPVDGTTWYLDGDSDGYGDAGARNVACDRPSGYVASGADCDDARDDVNPAGIETCPDGRDSDCDDTVDEDSFVISQEVELDSGSEPIYLIDLNFTAGTGRDLLVAGYGNGTVYHLENNGSGTFDIRDQETLGDSIRSLGSANLWETDHDNFVAVDTDGGPGARLFLVDTGSGGAIQNYYTFGLYSHDYGSTPRAVKALSCDADDVAEMVVVGDNDDGMLRMWALSSTLVEPASEGETLDLGTPRWDELTGVASEENGPIQIRLGDIDGVGLDDMVVANGGANTISVVYINDDGACDVMGVDELSSSAGYDQVSGVAVRDLDGDGDIDVAGAFKYSDRIVVFKNNRGTLEEDMVLVLPADAEPDGVSAPDLNDDGYNDLAIPYEGRGTLGLWVYDPDTDTFLESAEVDLARTGSSGGYSPREVEFNSKGDPGDLGFDGDGDEDLAVVNANADSVTILSGQCND